MRGLYEVPFEGIGTQLISNTYFFTSTPEDINLDKREEVNIKVT